jgi:hypothetical protein
MQSLCCLLLLIAQMCINAYATEPSLGQLIVGSWRLDVDAYLEKAFPEQDREFKRKFRDLASDAYVIIKENMIHMYKPGEEARSFPYTVLLEDQHQLLIEDTSVPQKERVVGKIVISDHNHIVIKTDDRKDKQVYLVRVR